MGNLKNALKVNKDALLEYERLKQNDLFSTIKRNTITDNAITVLDHNMRSLSKHIGDTVINPSDSICKIIATLKSFNININNNKNKFLTVTCRYKNVAELDKFDADGVSLFSFKDYAFANGVFTLMLVYS